MPPSRSPDSTNRPRPSTFSIVARDPDTDAVGIAVQSKFISVGAVVPFASVDAGAVATQSFANVAYGPDGLDLLRDGKSAAAVIDELTADDTEAPQRQVGVVGQDGSVAAFTGEECFDVAGDRQGETYTVQGNILANAETLDAMAEAYESTEGGLPERLIAALHAGNEAGGDSRGEQSAALYVAKPEGGYDGKNDRWIDVRVDDHEHPIDELERVFKLYDITLLSRAPPEETRELSGESARAVARTLSDLEFYDGSTSGSFGEAEREALEDWRGMNNFENHDLEVLEDALARGWEEAVGEATVDGDASGDGEATVDGEAPRDGEAPTGEQRMIEALWHGLSRLERV